jgi:peptidoglycan/LPS O-acetylase OafA/YrhL
MKKEFSVYLDFCRFIAAIIVVLTHLVDFGIVDHSLSRFIPTNGRDAVIVFFLLSGLVIFYTVHKKTTSLSEFIAARATRIYSVVIPVILLVVIIDLIGIRFNPENYSGLYQYAKLYIYVPFHLLFLGEIWTISEQPFTVPPYWSLGFEVWYYALFAVMYYYRGAKLAILFGVLFLFVGYKLWLLFPIWLSGIALLKLIEQKPLSARAGWLYFGLPIMGYVLLKQSGIDAWLISKSVDLWPFAHLPLGSAAKYLSDYVVCILFFCHLYGARFINLSAVMRYKHLITVLASYTFTLYLAHAPVMKTIHHNMHIDPSSISTSVIILLVVALVTWTLGMLTEQRKHMFLPIANRGVDLMKTLIKKAPWLERMLLPNR